MISLNRIVRIRKRMKEYTLKNPSTRMNELEKDFEKVEKKNQVIVLATFVSYFLLYVSVLSSIFGNFIVFSVFSKIASIFGTTILIILVTFLHWYMSVLVSDAHMIASEIVFESKN